jgi:AcrR family transcriptional regulator
MKVSSSPALRRGRPRDPRRDAAILEAAVELCAEVGYDRMTVDALAARAGVSKPTIYLRFPGGKAAVIAAAIIAHKAADEDYPDTGTLRGDLVAYVRESIAHVERNVHLAAGIAVQLRESPELAAIFHEHAVCAERPRVRAILARAAQRGEIDDADAVTPLFGAVGPSLIHTRVLLTADPVDDAFVDALVDDVLLPILSPRRPA